MNTPQQPTYGGNGYYPNAAPSAYHALPGQTLSWSGKGFAPNEEVTLTGPAGMVASWTAGTNGAFSGAGAFTVPFSYEDGTQTFTLAGSASGYRMSFKIVVGTFYPDITPSSYYVAPGQLVMVAGSGFAPGETVEWLINGSAAGTSAADARGSTSFTFNAPGGGNTFTLAGAGLSSGTVSTRTLTLMP